MKRRSIIFWGLISTSILLNSCLTLSSNNGEFKYIKNEQGIIIIDYVGTDSNLIVPDNINGIPVIQIRSLTKTVSNLDILGITSNEIDKSILTVTIPDSVQFIDRWAFMYLPSLKTLKYLNFSFNKVLSTLNEYKLVLDHPITIELIPNLNTVIYNNNEYKIEIETIINITMGRSDISTAIKYNIYFNRESVYGLNVKSKSFNNAMLSEEMPIVQVIKETASGVFYKIITDSRSEHKKERVFLNNHSCSHEYKEIMILQNASENVFYAGKNDSGYSDFYRNDSLLENNIVLFAVSSNGNNYAYTKLFNDSIYSRENIYAELYMNGQKYFTTSSPFNSGITKILFCPDNESLIFIELYAANRETVKILHYKGKTFGPFYYIEDDIYFSDDGKYFIYKHKTNNFDDWIIEKIEL